MPIMINGAYQPKFHCSFNYSTTEKVSGDVVAGHAGEAAQDFIGFHFPDSKVVVPGQKEADGKTWSFEVKGFNQRLWVYGE